MYSIGILTHEPVWEEKLSVFSLDTEFRISGSFTESVPELLPASKVFADSDVIWIPTPGRGFIECAIQAVKLSRHVLFGFPISLFPDQACMLMELANESRVQVQVGHHEHYNPAFRAFSNIVQQPQYIDLQHNIGLCGDDYEQELFHSLLTDIDVCISLVPDALKKFQSHTTYICEDAPPVIHVRLEFHNGTVASLNVDPFTSDKSIKMSVLQRRNILRVDLHKGTATMETFDRSGLAKAGTKSTIWPLNGFPVLSFDEDDPEFITGECLSFLHGLRNNLPSVSSLEQGCEALKITRNIFSKISITAD